MANDSLLALDEISESNPKEIGAVVYALACKSLNAPYPPNKGMFNILMD
jgi:hypothetical protein